MKKTIFFAVLAFVLAGFGLQTGTVHAQTADTAALKQQLDVAHATLVNLEMRAGMIPQGDTQIAEGPTAVSQPVQTTASAGLTESQIAYFDGVLTQLGTMLSELNTAVAANPNMNQAQLSAVVATLGTMKDTVSAISTQIAKDEQANASIATISPSAPAAAAGTGSNAAAPTVTAQATSSAPAGTAVTAAVNNAANPVAATAQASSFWSFTKANWPVLAIIALVIAILAILFWPEKEAKAPAVKSSGSAPSAKPASTPAPAQGQVMNAAAPKMPPAASVDQGMKKPA